jgi:hypothetical protein
MKPETYYRQQDNRPSHFNKSMLWRKKGEKTIRLKENEENKMIHINGDYILVQRDSYKSHFRAV